MNEWLAKGGMVYNPKDGYGAVGDGVTDDFDALMACYDDVPEGGVMFLPRANFRSASQLVFDRRVNVIGGGIGSAITVDVGGATDGIIFGAASLSYGVLLRHFAVLGGASAARYAAVFRNLAHSTVDGVYIKAGAEWAASIEGALINQFHIVAPGANMTFPYSATANTNGIRVVGSAGWPSNANRLNLIIEAITGDGLVVDGTVGTAGDFNNWITGTYEGIEGDGIRLDTCVGWTIDSAHLEGVDAADNPLVLDTCGFGRVVGTFNARATEVTACYNIVFESYRCDALTVDATSSRIEYRHMQPGIQGGAVSDSSTLFEVIGGGAAITCFHYWPDVILVNNTFGFTNIDGAAPTGKRVTFVFETSGTVTEGMNLVMAGNFTAGAGDSITFVCDGTNWIETGRSNN